MAVFGPAPGFRVPDEVGVAGDGAAGADGLGVVGEGAALTGGRRSWLPRGSAPGRTGTGAGKF